ncbi:MAG: 16S rRNA (guanine(527)-N(7))-methyltransferase RsmG [Bacteroidota bacterium]|nr:16S rRNA (guanine(527)-N(7))-methyltransferase RsmG [Bacteroidota bacterium]
MYKYFNLLNKYFPDINTSKLEKINKLYDIYKKLNKNVNLISRKNFDNFYLNHIIHSLSLTKFIYEKNIRIIDLVTGGGFPGIPLSIIFDKNEFILVDSIKKKIKALNSIVNSLSLKNVQLINMRMENISIKSDLIICRGVSSIIKILKWSKKSIKKNGKILLLKGGDVDKELIKINNKFEIFNLENIYSEDYFKDKKIIKIYN